MRHGIADYRRLQMQRARSRAFAVLRAGNAKALIAGKSQIQAAHDASGVVRCFFCWRRLMPPSHRRKNAHRLTKSPYLLAHPVQPMLAMLVNEPFGRAGWLFEVKWDGYRAIAEIADGTVRLYSRNLLSFADKFKTVTDELRGFGHDAVLDGEIVVLDAEGKSHFQLLQKYQKTGAGTLAYYAFDLLYLDGEDLRSRPLVQRKKMLTPLLNDNGIVRLSEHVVEEGDGLFRAATEQGLEGIMAKDGASPYYEGLRSKAWLKIKTRRRQEAVIGGFTRPRGSRRGLGSLVLGVFEDGKFVYVGHAGGGFNERSLAEVRARLEPLIQSTCPFAKMPKTNTPARWVKPKLVCEIAFQEWTGDGVMRQPIFLGLREDKSARAVVRERPKD
jgi:bifunctional non-homologous end joining protein LigD